MDKVYSFYRYSILLGHETYSYFSGYPSKEQIQSFRSRMTDDQIKKLLNDGEVCINDIDYVLEELDLIAGEGDE